MTLPILYSFRRCPYAMRARLAIKQAKIEVEIREVVLKAKPASMLAVSPKATVPVLLLPNGQVIDESLDIMLWALADCIGVENPEMHLMIQENDLQFKPWLDKYKYADRFPQMNEAEYRTQAECFIQQIELRLNNQQQDDICSQQALTLFGGKTSLTDLAIFPFVRQFAAVDTNWFNQSPYVATRTWLKQHVDSALFRSIMHKSPQWQDPN